MIAREKKKKSESYIYPEKKSQNCSNGQRKNIVNYFASQSQDETAGFVSRSQKKMQNLIIGHEEKITKFVSCGRKKIVNLASHGKISCVCGGNEIIPPLIPKRKLLYYIYPSKKIIIIQY